MLPHDCARPHEHSTGDRMLEQVLKENSEARLRGIVCEQELGDYA